MQSRYKERIVACISRTTTKAEASYSSWRAEALVIYFAVKKWRCYLEFSKFVIVSDHFSLQKLLNDRNDHQLIRWGMEISHFDFPVVHKPGVKHKDVDGINRAYDGWE